MRRIAWLLLAVVCTSFVQVQPLEPLKAHSCMCGHGKVPGACGMAGCGQAACPAAAVVTVAEPSRATTSEARRERPSRPAQPAWFLSASAPAGAASPLSAGTLVGEAARVPLFRVHCSLLI